MILLCMGYTMCYSLHHTLSFSLSFSQSLTPILLYSLSHSCLYSFTLLSLTLLLANTFSTCTTPILASSYIFFPFTPPELTRFSLNPGLCAVQNSLTHCALRTGSSVMVTVLSKERQKRLHSRRPQLQEIKSENLNPPLY